MSVSTIDDTQDTSPAALTLNVETTILNVGSAQSGHYSPECHIAAANFQSGDVFVVTEYIAVDTTDFRVYFQQTYYGQQQFPALRFHGKMLLANELYKLTIKQTAGTGRVVPYSCSVQVLTA